MERLKQQDTFIYIKAGRLYKKIEIDEILYIRHTCSVCEFIFRNTQPFFCCKSLVYFEERLTSYGFLRINRMDLVNISAISEISSISARKKKLSLVNGKWLSISYRRWTEIKANLIQCGH